MLLLYNFEVSSLAPRELWNGLNVSETPVCFCRNGTDRSHPNWTLQHTGFCGLPVQSSVEQCGTTESCTALEHDGSRQHPWNTGPVQLWRLTPDHLTLGLCQWPLAHRSWWTHTHTHVLKHQCLSEVIWIAYICFVHSWSCFPLQRRKGKWWWCRSQFGRNRR